jgi:hypothetical protein
MEGEEQDVDYPPETHSIADDYAQIELRWVPRHCTDFITSLRADDPLI